MIIQLDGLEIHLVRRKMKSVRIAIARGSGLVRVSAPVRVNERVIKEILASKLDWIKQQQIKMAALPAPFSLDNPIETRDARLRLQHIVPALMTKWQHIIGVEVERVSYRKMRTRWGSCNITKRRISLNLALAHKPLNCLEYIIVHELVHLLERYHNKRFYHFMDQFMPSWREHDAVLCSHS